MATPVLSLSEGTYSSDQSVAIADSTLGAAIHFTTDGSSPTAGSTAYANPIPVAGNGTTVTIRAIAAEGGMSTSEVVTAVYTIDYTCVATPEFDPSEGTYSGDQSVIITDSTDGATIHCTTNGSKPTTSSATYASGIRVAGDGTTVTIKAIAAKPGMATSTVAAAAYVIDSPWMTFGALGSGDGAFGATQWVALDSDGRIYVADTGNSRIARIDDMSGANWTSSGSFGSGINELNSPHGVTVDTGGRIFIADRGDHRIVRIDDLSGSNWTALRSSGAGIDEFYYPMQVALDGSGHVYVADQGNHRIVRAIVP